MASSARSVLLVGVESPVSTPDALLAEANLRQESVATIEFFNAAS